MDIINQTHKRNGSNLRKDRMLFYKKYLYKTVCTVKVEAYQL